MALPAFHDSLNQDLCRTIDRKLIVLFPLDDGPTPRLGSAISPYLFALILDELSRGIQESIPWCLIFSNDIALVSDMPKGLNERLKQWRETLEDKGLRVSGSVIHKFCAEKEYVTHVIQADLTRHDPGCSYSEESQLRLRQQDERKMIEIVWPCQEETTISTCYEGGVYYRRWREKNE
ncbi:hypothetical protein Tco_0921923 [Tanacetum coccineum]|uniref:Reverse transcriptase domain-containing protein n=1 Tax=Tanacetum coccineum TaxID=301880 RepID=A0ABQ5CXK5_9ASTR